VPFLFLRSGKQPRCFPGVAETGEGGVGMRAGAAAR
jgi:hypothetical protein